MEISDTITRKEAHDFCQQNTQTVQKNILRIMAEKKVSQIELSLRIDMEKQNLNYILRNPAARPGLDRLSRIANRLGVSIEELFKQ